MHSDGRQSHRFPVPADRSQALLRVGDDTVPAQLIDESASGYSMRMDLHPGVYEGETVWVLARDRWTKVRVARVAASAEGVCVGLDRVVEPADEHPLPDKAPRFRLDRIPSNHRVPGIIALAVLLTLGLVPLLQSSQFSVDGNGQAEQAEENSSTQSLQALGPMMFLTPAVARALQVTKGQARKIKEISARSDHALDLAKKSDSSPELLRRIVINARQEALTVLSRRQRDRWYKLLRLAEDD